MRPTMPQSIDAFYEPLHLLHEPPESSESPARVFELLCALDPHPATRMRPPADFGLDPVLAIHTAALIEFLQTAHARFAELHGHPRPAVPDSFAVRGLAHEAPPSIWGQLGYYCADTYTPILANTWTAAYWAAQTALSAARAVVEGAPMAYALCRPPGHHAYADLIGGYCYLNNAAIAAEWLAAAGRRVAIVDTDYHHGNGTQGIFYHRADVLVASLHADPAFEYPYFCGHAHERGEGDGLGTTLNIPLRRGTREGAYLAALEQLLTAVDRFGPDVVVVSHGFDTLADDPEGTFRLTTGSFEAIGSRLRDLGRPLLVVQEGGYRLGWLEDALTALLDGLRG